VLELAQEAAQPWARSRHWLYPISVRGVVSLVLLVRHRLDQNRVADQHLPSLPLEIWEMVLGYLRRGDCLRNTFRRHEYAEQLKCALDGSQNGDFIGSWSDYECSVMERIHQLAGEGGLRGGLNQLRCDVGAAEQQLARAADDPDLIFSPEYGCVHHNPFHLAPGEEPLSPEAVRVNMVAIHKADCEQQLREAVKAADFQLLKIRAVERRLDETIRADTSMWNRLWPFNPLTWHPSPYYRD
jgi:hypothetical protein